jgi:DNA mismatch repair protein MutH
MLTQSEILTSRAHVLNYLSAILPGKNLYELAEIHAITVRKNGKLNKGWAGQTIERVAKLEGGNFQKRDGFDFELKSTSLKKNGDTWKPKETIKITQLTPSNIIEVEFETSALWNKLAHLILVGCHHETEDRCTVIRVDAIDINDPILVDEIKKFWEEVRYSVLSGDFVDFFNAGSSKDLVQLRPTGDGKQWSTCPTTAERFPARAFYGTKRLIEQVLKL